MKRSFFDYSKYDMKPSDYSRMLSDQEGRCAICHDLPEKGVRLHIDHDHSTGDVRGLLCNRCNLLLGHARDSIEILNSAAKYLHDGGSPSRFYVETGRLLSSQ